MAATAKACQQPHVDASASPISTAKRMAWVEDNSGRAGGALLLLYALANRAGKMDRKGRPCCWHSMEKLAGGCNKSIRWARDQARFLERAGLIEVQARYVAGSDGVMQLTNLYSLNLTMPPRRAERRARPQPRLAPSAPPANSAALPPANSAAQRTRESKKELPKPQPVAKDDWVLTKEATHRCQHPPNKRLRSAGWQHCIECDAEWRLRLYVRDEGGTAGDASGTLSLA